MRSTERISKWLIVFNFVSILLCGIDGSTVENIDSDDVPFDVRIKI